MSTTTGALLAPCCNCGQMTPVAAMLRWPDGTRECVTCPSEAWLRRTYGERAADELVALREGRPDAPTLADLVATYPERSGFGVPRSQTHCRRGHRYSEGNTYIRSDGRRQCRACMNTARRARERRGVA
jgi:hypothetical protein